MDAGPIGFGGGSPKNVLWGVLPAAVIAVVALVLGERPLALLMLGMVVFLGLAYLLYRFLRGNGKLPRRRDSPLDP